MNKPFWDPRCYEYLALSPQLGIIDDTRKIVLLGPTMPGTGASGWRKKLTESRGNDFSRRTV
jgi:hypothetical protein